MMKDCAIFVDSFQQLYHLLYYLVGFSLCIYFKRTFASFSCNQLSLWNPIYVCICQYTGIVNSELTRIPDSVQFWNWFLLEVQHLPQYKAVWTIALSRFPRSFIFFTSCSSLSFSSLEDFKFLIDFLVCCVNFKQNIMFKQFIDNVWKQIYAYIYICMRFIYYNENLTANSASFFLIFLLYQNKLECTYVICMDVILHSS